ESPTALVAGSQGAITVRWRVGASQVPAETLTYLIVATSADVRFQGLGVLALTKNAPNPSKITFGTSQARIVLPLHNPTAARAGEIRVRPLRSGAIEIHWALAARTPCGEKILAQDVSPKISVGIGKAKIVIQNVFSLETPDRINVTSDGRYRLHAFP